MKILHVIDSAGIYGAENMLLSLMLEQVKMGDAPVLASIGTLNDTEKPLEIAARKLALEVKVFRMRSGLNIKAAYELCDFARNKDITLIHTHGYKGSILLSLIRKNIRRLPIVATLHGWTNTKKFSKLRLYEFLDRYLLSYKDAVVLVSPSMLTDKRVIKARVDPEKLSVIENGVNFEDTQQDVKDDHISHTIQTFCQKDYVIGAIGRLSREKGYDYLLTSIRRVLDKGHKVKLIILGEGNCRAELQEQINISGLSKHVLLVGYAENAKNYLQFFHVFVISSLTEGFPITLLEAMNAKIPVVSTRVGCLPEVLEKPDSGLLVSPQDPVALAEALMKLKNDPSLAIALADCGYEKVCTRYSSQTMAEKYQIVYKQVVLGANAI